MGSFEIELWPTPDLGTLSSSFYHQVTVLLLVLQVLPTGCSTTYEVIQCPHYHVYNVEI